MHDLEVSPMCEILCNGDNGKRTNKDGYNNLPMLSSHSWWWRRRRMRALSLSPPPPPPLLLLLMLKKERRSTIDDKEVIVHSMLARQVRTIAWCAMPMVPEKNHLQPLVLHRWAPIGCAVFTLNWTCSTHMMLRHYSLCCLEVCSTLKWVQVVICYRDAVHYISTDFFSLVVMKTRFSTVTLYSSYVGGIQKFTPSWIPNLT
jgi:hypothetical protein